MMALAYDSRSEDGVPFSTAAEVATVSTQCSRDRLIRRGVRSLLSSFLGRVRITVLFPAGVEV